MPTVKPLALGLREDAIWTILHTMSFAEIKAELPKLTPSERAALALELEALRDFNDTNFLDELTRRNRDAENGQSITTDEQFRARLRELRRDG
jgi:hypothetical protein